MCLSIDFFVKLKWLKSVLNQLAAGCCEGTFEYKAINTSDLLVPTNTQCDVLKSLRLWTSEPMMEVDDCPALRLDGLPAELLLHIFQYLDVEFILRAVSKVSLLRPLPLADLSVDHPHAGVQPLPRAGFGRGHVESPGGQKISRYIHKAFLGSGSDQGDCRSVSCTATPLGLLLGRGLRQEGEGGADVEDDQQQGGGGGEQGHHHMSHCSLCSCKRRLLNEIFCHHHSCQQCQRGRIHWTPDHPRMTMKPSSKSADAGHQISSCQRKTSSQPSSSSYVIFIAVMMMMPL